MKIFRSPAEMRSFSDSIHSRGQKIAFVPTMGALHAGHVSLIDRAFEVSDVVVVSIFVNPIQFGPSEDFESYPRTFEDDCFILKERGVHAVYAPTPSTMYPNGFSTTVSCGGITETLEGASRPGHFDGVTTVVLKLCMSTGADFAVFGQKDVQQLLVIEKMVKDLDLPFKVLRAPTVRESDGLAMSSRNRYLTETERLDAPSIYMGLEKGVELWREGFSSVLEICNKVQGIVEEGGLLVVEYVKISDSACHVLDDEIIPAEGSVLSIACRTAQTSTRLIDNVLLIKKL